MTIEKLPSGSYRATIIRNKVKYRVTFDHKPTMKEAEEALRKKMITEGQRPNGDLTFSQASLLYVQMKKNILSPNTAREYLLMPNRVSPWFGSMSLDSIDQIAINKQVNEWAARLSPKTVHNYHGFISTVLGTFRPDMRIYTTLPQKRKIEPYVPSDDDVKLIMAEMKKNPDYYVGFILACYGLRRGEICALNPSDVDLDGTVHINKAVAVDPDRKKVIKKTKTTESQRDIIIPQEIASLIHEQGFVYQRKLGGITEKLEMVEKKLGIPKFPLHKLRHYFASKMLTITDKKTVQELGGWKTDYVMNNIYAHSMKEEKEKAKRLAAKELSKSIF